MICNHANGAFPLLQALAGQLYSVTYTTMRARVSGQGALLSVLSRLFGRSQTLLNNKVVCTMPSLSRRQFAKLLHASALPLFLSPAYSAAVAATAADTSSAQPDERETLASFGDAILQQDPSVAAKLERTARVALQLAPGSTIDWSIAEQAKAALTAFQRVKSEFAEGKALFVEGWFVSESEAAVAILYALAARGASV